MDVAHDIRDIIREVIAEELPLREAVMAPEAHVGLEWNTLLRSTLEDLFHDVGVQHVDANRSTASSRVEVTLANGDNILGATTVNPLSGTIIINGSHRTELNGPQAMRLISSMRDAWEKYSQGT